MVAPKGNQFWKMRSSHGRKPTFPDPETLWDACTEYFEWVDANPLLESRPFPYQGEVRHEPVAKMRAMTLAGMFIFLDISRKTWDLYREREEYQEVTNRVDAIIRTQKFEGAAADLLNHAIIARELGLAERQEFTGKDGGPIELSDKEVARQVAFMLAKGLQQG